MLNRSILLLFVTSSLCAIYTSAAPKKIVSQRATSSYDNFFDVESKNKYQKIGRENEDESLEIVLLDDNRHARSSYENVSDFQSKNKYQTIEHENENESPEIVLLDENLDDLKLARKVVEADYVPPLKYAYETGNGELRQRTIGNSQIDDVEKVEEFQDSSDEIEEAVVREIGEESLMKALADLEAQIIPNSKALSDQSEDDEEGHIFDKNDRILAEEGMLDIY